MEKDNDITEVTTNFVWHLCEKHVYNKKIKKGLKDGSIEIIDGEFYEKVENIVEEA